MNKRKLTISLISGAALVALPITTTVALTSCNGDATSTNQGNEFVPPPLEGLPSDNPGQQLPPPPPPVGDTPSNPALGTPPPADIRANLTVNDNFVSTSNTTLTSGSIQSISVNGSVTTDNGSKYKKFLVQSNATSNGKVNVALPTELTKGMFTESEFNNENYFPTDGSTKISYQLNQGPLDGDTASFDYQFGRGWLRKYYVRGDIASPTDPNIKANFYFLVEVQCIWEPTRPNIPPEKFKIYKTGNFNYDNFFLKYHYDNGWQPGTWGNFWMQEMDPGYSSDYSKYAPNAFIIKGNTWWDKKAVFKIQLPVVLNKKIFPDINWEADESMKYLFPLGQTRITYTVSGNSSKIDNNTGWITTWFYGDHSYWKMEDIHIKGTIISPTDPSVSVSFKVLLGLVKVD